jgi:hypothetical protein
LVSFSILVIRLILLFQDPARQTAGIARKLAVALLRENADARMVALHPCTEMAKIPVG